MTSYFWLISDHQQSKAPAPSKGPFHTQLCWLSLISEPGNVYKISIIIVTVSQKAEFSNWMLSSQEEKQRVNFG